MNGVFWHVRVTSFGEEKRRRELVPPGATHSTWGTSCVRRKIYAVRVQLALLPNHDTIEISPCHEIMSTTTPPLKPLATPVPDAIAYVTDSPRDASFLMQAIDAPVIFRPPAKSSMGAQSPAQSHASLI
jgi:hypothetical protein